MNWLVYKKPGYKIPIMSSASADMQTAVAVQRIPAGIFVTLMVNITTYLICYVQNTIIKNLKKCTKNFLAPGLAKDDISLPTHKNEIEEDHTEPAPPDVKDCSIVLDPRGLDERRYSYPFPVQETRASNINWNVSPNLCHTGDCKQAAKIITSVVFLVTLVLCSLIYGRIRVDSDEYSAPKNVSVN